jgi:hypothetical protein
MKTRIRRPRFRVRTLIIVIGLVVVAIEAWPMYRRWELRRDGRVLEAVLADILDPKNPEMAGYVARYGGATQVIVDHRTMGRTEWSVLGLERRLPAVTPVPVFSQGNLAWRNAGEQIPVAAFGLRDPRVLVQDLEAEVPDGVGLLWAMNFQKRYPVADGYLRLARPGYSLDGRTALVVTRGGPSYHGMIWIHLLTYTNRKWRVSWRHRHFFD